ncbi:barstar family protein [Amycolatopsis sp.]|uniref:barstar family protein n=1 Tax=Amycolatopsis sp. TaxID=37632 RepID=UPI002D808D84|nr:barstar family protein [Amycolatopsis sp.]
MIDGKSVRSEQDVHDQLKRQLDFGPYYGDNLSALWDRLYRDVERPVELLWRDSETSRANLGAELFDTIAKLLNDVMEDDAGKPPDERFAVRFA